MAAKMSADAAKAATQQVSSLLKNGIKAARQDIEASIMAKSNEQPDYLYKWMERRIIHTRSAAIIKREKRRGNLDHATAMQVRAAINPLTAKRLAVAELTPEEQADRRRAKQAEYKRNRRNKGKA